MKLIVVSGRSGSGKTSCLHLLEDLGYYCVDNIPASMLAVLAQRLSSQQLPLEKVAVSIDARNIAEDLRNFPQIHQSLLDQSIKPQIIFLDAEDKILIKRFSETRRKHPLTSHHLSLLEAISQERTLLEPIATLADLAINTSTFSLHQLRDLVKNRVAENDGDGMALQFQSFGFKYGVPVDTDMVYDARCLPNPFWDNELRRHSGLDEPVIKYLEAQPEVLQMYEDIRSFLERWLPRFQSNNRSYITVSIGCTGGQHRSVYLCEKLRRHFQACGYNAQVRHKELA
ncbi:MAG: RNase adapter RapZ [Pseudohongiellaceae bacterium]|jgi:RNase adapter protein RapZ